MNLNVDSEQDPEQAYIDWERHRAERESRWREKEFGQRQRLQKRLDLLLLTTAIGIASMLLVALLLGLSLREQHARDQRARRLAEATYELQQRQVEFDLIARALSAGTEQERARGLDFLIKAGFLPASSPRLRFFSPKDSAGLPRLPWADERPESSPSDGPPRSVSQVKRASPVQVAERPAVERPVAASAVGEDVTGPSIMDEKPAEPAKSEPRKRAVRDSDSDLDGDGGGGNVYDQAQRTLKARGYYTGPVDGRYDTNTKEAVARFQRAHDLNDDGLLGPRTLRAIRKLRNEKRSDP